VERRTKNQLGWSAVAVTLALVLSSCTQEENTEAQATAPHRPGEILVKFENTISIQQSTSLLASAGLESVAQFASIGVHRCRITNGSEVNAAISACEGNASVQYAEPNYIYNASEIPNDPRFNELWAMQNDNDADIDAVEAWDSQTGSADVLVAIIDTGVDYTHSDLGTNMWRNPGESGEGREDNGVDDDGNGFVDDVFGWDFAGNDSDPLDDNGHGTHVAGTIAAAGNNGVGVVGVNWQASIMALKFLSSNGSGSAADAIDAILYAANNGARVMNNSWGGGGFSQALKDAIEFARDRNALFVAAAGNDGRDNDSRPTYPSNYDVDNVVAVAASDRNDLLASFSNFGATTVDLAAPGADILSTMPSDQYRSLNGTSMATPHVSGVAALVLAHAPDLNYRQVAVRVVGSTDAGAAFENTTGSGGRLNAAAALSDEPKLAFVTRLSNTPDTAGPYSVSALATDNGSIQAAALSFTVDGGSATVLPMQSTGPEAYRAAIPGQALGATIAYFVEVTDDENNNIVSATYSFQIAEGGDDGPDCGNFAVTIPAITGTSGRLLTLLLNVILFSAFVLGARRLVQGAGGGRRD
jgi:subtilisin family serine protease